MIRTPYPLHYFLNRPYSRPFLRELEAPAQSLRDFRQSERLALGLLVPWLTAQGWDQTAVGLPSSAVLSQELQGALCWGQWAIKGRKIISVHNSLSRAFEHSDVSDMQMLDVLPLDNALYLHFEGDLETPLAVCGQGYFEGAYVLYSPGVSARIILCSKMPGKYATLVKWRERYDLRLPAECLTMPADEAIDFALAQDLVDLKNARTTLLMQGASPEALLSVDTLTAHMTEGHAAFRQALRLVLNALAYLKGYSQDSRIAWPANAPPRLTALADAGTPTEKKRGLSKLWGLGHVPITYLGETFAETLVRNSSLHEMRSHWRRGHWRHQPYGPAMSLRKLIWLQPTLVGASSPAST